MKGSAPRWMSLDPTHRGWMGDTHQRQTKGKDGTTTTPSLRKEWDTSPVDGDNSTACIHEYALEAVVQAMVEPQGLERASTAANASQLEQHLRTEVGVSSLRDDSVPSNWGRPTDI